jgi:hypothetical protein
LKNHQREFVVPATVDHFPRGVHNQVHLLGGKLAEFSIRQRRTLLDETERLDDGPPPAIPTGSDQKVLKAALGFRSP